MKARIGRFLWLAAALLLFSIPGCIVVDRDVDWDWPAARRVVVFGPPAPCFFPGGVVVIHRD